MTIFIDTGAFFARYLVKDQHHNTSISLWNKIYKEYARCFTSNFVLDEMITLLGRRVNEEFALEKANSIYNSNFFTILRPEETDELAALEFYKKFSDQKISFTDCVSFALMKRHKIESVFSFDRHFTHAGFSKI